MDERYRQLREKVDQKVAELQAMHSASLQCRRSCHSCCLPDLTVFPVEAEAIREFVREDSDRQAAVLALETKAPFGKSRCLFLDEEGACSIYETRPIVCRTHGLPLEYKDGEGKERDVCPLNFQEKDLSSLAPQELLNLDLINTLLSLIDQNTSGAEAGKRIPLVASHLLT